MKAYRKLAVGFLFSLGLAGAVEAQVIGYWNFEEKPPGSLVDNTTNAIIDSSGNGHSGTVADTGPFYVAGNSNYAGTSGLEFTLGPDHVDVPDPSGVFNFSYAQSMTLEAMIRTTAIGEDGIGSILCKQGANPGEWWWRINAAGTQQFYTDDGSGSGGKSTSGTKKINDGQWHHLAAVYDSNAQQLRVYVDYALDGTPFSNTPISSGTIGNAEDLWIAAFQAGNRQFEGDFDFVKITSGALTPAQFVQPLTYITSVTPTNGSGFLPASTTAGFEVKSSVGVATNAVHVLVGTNDISAQLQYSGNANDWQVTLPALVANRFYSVAITVADTQGHQAFATNAFDTFDPNSFSFEAEDYNFGGGQFIDNPQLSSNDGPNNYLDRLGTQLVDFAKTNPPTTTLYRIGDAIGTAVSGDVLRQAYVTAEASDPGVADYFTKDFIDGEWVNYTRTFPAGSYHVYARLAKAGVIPMVMRLDQVTSDATAPNQTTTPIGNFIGAPTGGAQSYVSVPLVDAFGRELSVPLSGVETLRLTMISGVVGMSQNYYLFVPEGGTQVPYAAALAPAVSADNEATNTSIHATIRNGDTSINTGSVQFKVDGTVVSPTVTPTATGAQIDYAPASFSVGLHTNILIYTDSVATSITNTWQFRVASLPVRGLWNFNEKTAGSFVSIATGAILDSSSNSRNGTANDPTTEYVSGSFNYGNTTALLLTPGIDRVVVPDHSGDFNYNGSFTWEAVVRSTSTATNLAILAKNGTGDGEGEYWWRMPGPSGGVQYVGMNDGSGGKFIAGTAALNDGNWHHVAVVYDTNLAQIRLYADYKLDATLTNVLFTNTIGRPQDLTIGSFYNGGSDFDGDIDLIRISSGALTTAQFVQTTVALAPLVTGIHPGNNAINVFPTPLIELDVQNRDTQVLTNTVKMYIDSASVTPATTLTTNGAAITYRPANALADGLHTVLVTFNDTASPANFITNQWVFSVVNNEPILGLYQLNEQAPGNPANTTAGAILDSSGNNHNGTLSGTATVQYVEGSTNFGDTSALEFTAAGADHIAVPDPTGAFNFTTVQSITLEAVIRTTNIGQAGVGSIVAKQLAATPEWWWRINATGLQQFNINDSTGAKSVSGTKKLNDGQWHHLAVLFDGQAKQLRAYVDYVQDGATVKTTYTIATNVIGSAEDLWIAAFQTSNRYFDGDIDVVRITGAALDTSWFIPIGGVVASSPRVSLTNVSNVSGSLSFSFLAPSGHSYVVQSTPALGGSWTDVITIPGDGATHTVSYSQSGSQSFYRVKTQ